ncbi:MAG: UDP-glucose 4-epimerase GalE [Trueperella sp.]|nr:UDP-glucose 4-epimerase GalE [Trueperella sp.]
MAWLVTGGAGYIGSHVVHEFLRAGLTPIVLDDFSTGRREFVPSDVTVIEASILDRDAVRRALEEYECTGVVSLAGYKYAGESVKYPLHTYEQNVTGIVALLGAMQDAGVHNYVFSSSASVYGTPKEVPVTEETPYSPESPYGETKVIGELLARDMAKIDPQWRYTNLRYFNVVGAGDFGAYDASPYSLFSITFNRLLAGKNPTIFGGDYPTPDGTCIRDYIHVSDLAYSHVAAAKAMDAGVDLLDAYNLGSGDGSSVADIMREMKEHTGIDFEPEIVGRRPGDPAAVVADGTLAARDLEWEMRHSMADMVRSAWDAKRAAESL